MNSQFSAYTRQTAFQITLNAESIDALFFMYRSEVSHRLQGYSSESGTSRDAIGGRCADYLRRRGLVELCDDPGLSGCYKLTKAGRLMTRVCWEAGFEDKWKRLTEMQKAIHDHAVS